MSSKGGQGFGDQTEEGSLISDYPPGMPFKGQASYLNLNVFGVNFSFFTTLKLFQLSGSRALGAFAKLAALALVGRGSLLGACACLPANIL